MALPADQRLGAPVRVLAGAPLVGMAVAAVLVVMAAVNVWVHLGPGRAHPFTGPLAALVLLLIGRAAGLSWAAMGFGGASLAEGARWGALTAGIVAVGYVGAAAVPRVRPLFRDARYQVGTSTVLYIVFVAIPLGTVVFEEVAFRGVLWGLLADGYGATAATVVSSALFGIWHVLPALRQVRANPAMGGRARAVAGTVVFTALAGVLFAELRHLTGSLLAPALLHWATNAVAVLVAARLWAIHSPRAG